MGRLGDQSDVGDVREESIRVDGARLSGLVARPSGTPRALVLALHGAGTTSGYFDARTDRRLSLLALGAELGFTVWAPDRPGYGASADLADVHLGLGGQVDLLYEAIEAFAQVNEIGAGCLVVGHSYGLKVAIAMAADRRGDGLLGVDGSGAGIRYTFNPGTGRPPAAPGDRNAIWGPSALYPPATFRRGMVATARAPGAQTAEAPAWPADFERFAPEVVVPVRFTFGDHERLWSLSEEHFAELRAKLVRSPRVEVHLHRAAGHNLSLGYSARAYHLRVLAFAEECVHDAMAAGRDPGPVAGTAGRDPGPVAVTAGAVSREAPRRRTAR